MAPRVPKRIDAEIYELLNESIASGISIPDIQFQGLIRKAEQLPIPHRYACLSALYSHSLNYDRAIENAINSIKYGDNEQYCVENALSALSNNKLFSDIVAISKKYPILLNYSDSRNESYDAALYTFDLDYCEYIANNFELRDDETICDYKLIKEHLNDDKDLINNANEYFTYVFSGLTDLLRKYTIRTDSFSFGLIGDPIEQFLEVNISLHNASIDQTIDLESEWYSHIANFDVSERQLCNVSFVIGASE